MGDHRTTPTSVAFNESSSKPQESLSTSVLQKATRLSGGPKSTSASTAAYYVSPKPSTNAINQHPSKKSSENSPGTSNVTPPTKSNSTGAVKQPQSESAKRKYSFDFSNDLDYEYDF